MGNVITLAAPSPSKKAKVDPGGRWEKWKGGRCWIALDGSRTYYIRRRAMGRRYQIKTAATTPHAAALALDRFENDPAAFTAAPDRPREPVYLDDRLAAEFLAWSKRPKKEGGAGNTLRWVTQQRLYLAWWASKLKGVDLRRATLRANIKPALVDCTCRPQRIAVLKRLYSWLRKVDGELTAPEDPTLNDLPVPQYEPAQQSRSKVRTKAEIVKVKAALGKTGKRWRDILDFLAATGAHTSEAERFASSGTIEALPKGMKRPGVAGVIIIPKTKTGGAHKVAVSKPGLEAAKRLLAAGSFDQSKLRKALAAASIKAGVPNLTPGTLRHSVATAAVNAGTNMEAVADALHHADKRTTARWYATLGVPAKIPTLV